MDSPFLAALRTAQTILVAVHVRPDGDAIASLGAAVSILRDNGFQAFGILPEQPSKDLAPFLPAEGGGPDSGAPVQHIHLQPGIIRQQDAGDAFGSGKRLERGVLRKRDSRFIHGRSLGIVGKILHFPFPGQHGADFPGLVGVACGNHQQRQFLFHNHQSLTVKLA